MKKLYKNRLLKLADHLENGKLGHKIFDFSTVNYSSTGKFDENGCGTNGCALGELPFVFPRHFKFISGKERGLTVIYEGWNGNVYSSSCHFFGLSRDETNHLFVPFGQHPEFYGGKSLNILATKTEVADNILAFIETKEKK